MEESDEGNNSNKRYSRHVTIRQHHHAWLTQNCKNLSEMVRMHLDDEMIKLNQYTFQNPDGGLAAKATPRSGTPHSNPRHING